MKGPAIMSGQSIFVDESRNRMTVDTMGESYTSMASKKRKRGSTDHDANEPGSHRGSLSNMNGNGDHMNGTTQDSFPDTNEFANLQQHLQNVNNPSHDPSSTAAAALAAQLGGGDPTGLSFGSTGSVTEGDRQIDSSFDLGPDSQGRNAQNSPYANMPPYAPIGGTAAQVQAAREASNGGSMKPAVGTDEWHKVRRDNHKEVERRRRETINEGINELAKIVPGCEKNKGSILQRAVHYILDLKRQLDEQNDKRALEKVVLEQALAEVSNRNEEFKSELEKAWAEGARKGKEIERLKKVVSDNGIEVTEGEEGDGEE